MYYYTELKEGMFVYADQSSLSNLEMVISLITLSILLTISGITLSRVAKAQNNSRTWWGWVPILKESLLFELGGGNPRWMIVFCFFGIIPVLNVASVIGFLIYRGYIIGRLCRKYKICNAWAFFSVIFPLLYYLWLIVLNFKIKKNEFDIYEDNIL